MFNPYQMPQFPQPQPWSPYGQPQMPVPQQQPVGPQIDEVRWVSTMDEVNGTTCCCKTQ